MLRLFQRKLSSVSPPNRYHQYHHVATQKELTRLSIQHNYYKSLLYSSLMQLNLNNKSQIKVLDIGFGTGDVMGEMVNYFDKNVQCIIHGIDNEPKWHNYVENKFENEIKSGKICLHNVDITNLNDLVTVKNNNGCSNQFDIIIIRWVLTHIRNYESILLTIINELLTNNNGYIIIQDTAVMSKNNIFCINPYNITEFEHIHWFLENILSDKLFGNAFNLNTPFEVPRLLSNVDSVNIIFEEDMIYGGKHGSIGYDLTLDAIQGLSYSLFTRKKITETEKENISRDLQKFKQINWSKAYFGFVTSIVAQKSVKIK